MYQRLLLLLAVMCFSGAVMSQNVMTPADGDYIFTKGSTNPLLNPVLAPAGIIQKWVHDPNQNGKSGRIPWNQTNFKSYHLNNIAFRLRFPNNYDPSKSYPCVVFLHGAGESAFNNDPDDTTKINGTAAIVNRENQDQLYWGAQLFEQRINNNEWNGFLLFPQLLATTSYVGSQWDDNTFPTLNAIMDTLNKYNGLDLDRIIVQGLSAGGGGDIAYSVDYPKRIATVVASSPEGIAGYVASYNTDNHLDNVAQINYWISGGGQDFHPGSNGPDFFELYKGRDSLTAHGTKVYTSFYTNSGHDTWEVQWNTRNASGGNMLSSYWNAAHKAQPVVYFQKTQFCTTETINAKMGITAGFASYEWQADFGGGYTTVAGPSATANNYIATAAGSYRVHFKRTATSDWSAWTPVPVVISTKTCNITDTAFAEHFEEAVPQYVTLAGIGNYTNSSYAPSFYCQNGLFPNATEVITQDGTGNQGGRFLLSGTNANARTSSSSPGPACVYSPGDQVWRTYNPANVQPGTDYTLSFYMANSLAVAGQPAYLTATVNGTALTPAGGVKVFSTGDASWKKYSYTWNSGFSTTAEIAIINNTLSTSYNDFALDEITLVKAKPQVIPALAAKSLTFWAKGGSVNDNSPLNNDGSKVTVWNNNIVNGNPVYQTGSASAQPTYKNNGTDNINFNPVITYNTANSTNLLLDSGFAGNKVHTAVHAYIVGSFSNVNQNNNSLLNETGNNSNVYVNLENNGQLLWIAGDNTLNGITTPNNSIVANTPAVWSFSKDNINGTTSGGGAKQDIRKDGGVLASSINTTTFTGNYSSFYTGAFDGNVAEIIYLLDSSITPLTENKIESYLALKYGTTLGKTSNPVKYTASDGTTIFWPLTNSAYQNDVFGIGTDSSSGLVQAISNSANSGSGDGTGQSKKGNLVLSTSTTLLDKQFLMIGNDAGALTEHKIASGEAQTIAVGSWRVLRNWKVVNTNSVGVVNISFDTTGNGNQQGGSTVSNYALMVDVDGDGSYNTGTLAFFTASSASGKKIIFSNVTIPNGAVFTVITNKLLSALPAIWLGFTADAVNGNAVLNWKTGDEMNVSRYNVEHSFNNVSFTTVGTVAAKNSTGTNQYTLTDIGLAPGIHYYRIRRIDLDANSGLSETKTVNITTTGANVVVRPNPVVGSTLTLGVSVQQSTKSRVQVMAADGKVIVQQSISLGSGTNTVNLNISSVPPGIYLVQVQLSDGVVTKKFIKERQ